MLSDSNASGETTMMVAIDVARPLAILLEEHHACEEALEWAGGYTSAAAAWDACHRPDWMLWALDSADWRDDRLLRLFACWCVRHTPLPDGRTVWDLLTDERSRTAVEVAERFARGEATPEELAAAKHAAKYTIYYAANGAAWATTRPTARDAARSASWAARAAALKTTSSSAQADALRRIVGNPFADKRGVK